MPVGDGQAGKGSAKQWQHSDESSLIKADEPAIDQPEKLMIVRNDRAGWTDKTLDPGCRLSGGNRRRKCTFNCPRQLLAGEFTRLPEKQTGNAGN